MKDSDLLFNILTAALGVVIIVAVCGLAAGFVSGRADAHTRYLVSLERLEQGSHAARKLCVSLSGADWESCITRALVAKWRAVAEAEAAHRNTPESYRVQRFVAAGTAFLTQTQQCGALPGAARATCDKAALEAYREAVSRVTAPELTEQSCAFTGCPGRARPAGVVAKPREV